MATNRYDSVQNFVAPTERPRGPSRAVVGEIIEAAASRPMAAPDVAQAYAVTNHTSRDSVSAVDRANALQIRAKPVWIMTGLGATAVSLGYTAAGMAIGVAAPLYLDRIIVGLVVFVAMGMHTYLRLNRMDFDHSRAGVDRLRIITAGEVAKEVARAEAQIRTEALRASLRLLDDE